MGNYFASLPYINSGHQTENNNRMDTNIPVKEHRVPKISNYLNDVDSILSVNKLQSECNKDSSVILKIWNRLNNLCTSPFAPCTTNLIEESSQIISLEENSQINSARKNSWTKDGEAELDHLISFRLNSQRYRKDCFRYITPITPTSWKNECEEESGFINFILNSKRYQTPQAQDYVQRSQDRPLPSFSFQRLDSGIEEDSIYTCTTRTQIDWDSLYLTMKRTVDCEESCRDDLMCGTGRTQGYHKSISFFIDIRDPLKQKPLDEEYLLASSECDSMFSDMCSESSNEDYLDDDFICFEESHSEEQDGCQFSFTLNTCTPAELSCSVSANSTTCFDISMDTSSNKNRGKPNKESTMSVKIDVRPGGTGKTHESPILINNSSNDSGCAEFSIHEFASETTYMNRVKTSTSSFAVCTNSCIIDDDECTLIKSNYTSEVTNKNKSSKLKNSSFEPTEKKKSQKKVCFQKDEDLVEVHQMIHWDFAYREARKGNWEVAAVDRCRFWRRIKELELILSPCLRRKLGLVENI